MTARATRNQERSLEAFLAEKARFDAMVAELQQMRRQRRIARDDAGQLCGVGTAMIKVLPRLRQPTYYYRQFFAKALRGQHQELAFYQACKQVLQTYNQSLAQAESLGVLLEIENAKIAHAYNQAIVPGFEAVFIGYSPRGLQLRVAYFDDAILLTPAPIRMQALPSGRAATR